MSNIDSVKALYQAFVTKDIFTVLRLVSGDVTVVQSPELPWGGEYHGLGGLKNFFEKLTAQIESHVEIEEYFEAGDRVIAIGRTRGKVRSNQNPFDVRVVHIWTFQGSKAVRFEPYIENTTILPLL